MKKLALLISIFSLNASVVFAEPTTSTQGKQAPAASHEKREEMAAHHEKMAVCLRSDKPVQECHEEMHKNYKGHMGKDECPMMGKKGMKGHHKKMMEKNEDAAAEPKK